MTTVRIVFAHTPGIPVVIENVANVKVCGNVLYIYHQPDNTNINKVGYPLWHILSFSQVIQEGY